MGLWGFGCGGWGMGCGVWGLGLTHDGDLHGFGRRFLSGYIPGRLVTVVVHGGAAGLRWRHLGRC